VVPRGGCDPSMSKGKKVNTLLENFELPKDSSQKTSEKITCTD